MNWRNRRQIEINLAHVEANFSIRQFKESLHLLRTQKRMSLKRKWAHVLRQMKRTEDKFRTPWK